MKLHLLKFTLLITVFFSFAGKTHTAIIYVNTAQAGGNQDGTSWENAFTELTAAIQVADYGDEIWVAQGIYLPTTSAIRGISFTLKNGVEMYGGFTGMEQSLEERDWELYPTVLSGDIGITGDSTDNSYTVVYCEMVDSTTRLDGFIVERGNADATFGSPFGLTRSGGGLYIHGSSTTEDSRPRITNCTFQYNFARQYGGGCFVLNNSSGGSAPLLSQCTFQYNKAGSGGGVQLKGGSLWNVINIEDCLFMENYADNGGGFDFLNEYGLRDVRITECRFLRNFAQAAGGGAYLEKYNQSSLLQILSSDFEQNECHGDGFAFADFNFSNAPGAFISNCYFNANFGNFNGNGILSILEDNDLVIEHSVFSNSNFTHNAALYVLGSNIRVINCLFYKLESFDGPSLLRMSIISPTPETLTATFTNCIITKNSGTNGQLISNMIPTDLHFNNCIIYDNNTVIGEPFIHFQNGGNLQLSHSLVDFPDCASMTNGNVSCDSGMLYELDPMFVDTANHDYRLLPCSPARNAGGNDIVIQLGLLTDLAGSPRTLEDIVDIGAYEIPEFQVLIDTIGHIACYGESSGNFSLSIFSGCGPYTVMLGDDGLTTDSTVISLDGLSAGSYALTVTDAQGRELQLEVIIEQPLPINIEIEATDTVCIGVSDGTASALVTGGTMPYTYLWNGGSSDSTITGLSPGSYSLTVTDVNECISEQSINIAENTAIVLDTTILHATGPDIADGSIIVNQVNGGIAPYHFQWSTGHQTQSVDDLLPGNYSLTITDAIGCEYYFSFDVDFEVATSTVFGDALSFELFPNPVFSDHHLFLRYDSRDHFSLKLRLRDLTGRTVWVRPLDIVPGVSSHQIPSPEISGLYFLIIENNRGKSVQLKCLVQ